MWPRALYNKLWGHKVTLQISDLTSNVMVPFELVLIRGFELRQILLLLPQTARLRTHKFVSCDACCATLGEQFG